MPPRKYKDTLLTEEQVKVLMMRAKGMTIDEIAKVLGVSKADVHAVLKNALTTIRKARNTLNLYARITGYVVVSIDKGSKLEDVIELILKEADLHNIRLRMRSSDILVYIMKYANECIDIEKLIINCNLKLFINPKGYLRVEKH